MLVVLVIQDWTNQDFKKDCGTTIVLLVIETLGVGFLVGFWVRFWGSWSILLNYGPHAHTS